MVGDAAARAVKHELGCLPLGAVAIRGRDTPEPAWVMLPPAPHSARGGREIEPISALWRAMREAADAGRTPQALALLDRIDAAWPGCAPCAWQRDPLAAPPAEASG